MDKTALEQMLSSYNGWMEASTIAVAIGILGEYVAHFAFEKEARSNRLEMAISILCGVVVLSGVVGEWIVGSKLSQASQQLQQIADTEVAKSNAQAETARAEAERARRDASEANDRAARTEKEAARLNKLAEDERLARLNIQEQMKPRRVNSKQHDLVVALLRGRVGTPIFIETIPGGADTTGFSEELVRLFQDSKFAVSFSRNTVGGPPSHSGLQLLFKPGYEAAARAVSDALMRAGIANENCALVISSSSTVENIALLVGAKTNE